jgi:tRNA threonylcarbamoyladenosine biosynthesis protein TsaB
VLVLGIETSTPRTSVALGSEGGPLASIAVASTRPNHEVVIPSIRHLLRETGVSLRQVGGIAVGLGPGLFTGMRVGVATAKTLAQVLSVPVVGLASLDVLAYAVRFGRRLICAAIDAKRGEVFFAFYRPVPGGVARESDFGLAAPASLQAELVARPEDILLVGNGALAHRRVLEEAGSHVEFASPAFAHPDASAMVELAIPRFRREEFDRVFELVPHYLRKADAEIAWDRARRGA